MFSFAGNRQLLHHAPMVKQNARSLFGFICTLHDIALQAQAYLGQHNGETDHMQRCERATVRGNYFSASDQPLEDVHVRFNKKLPMSHTVSAKSMGCHVPCLSGFHHASPSMFLAYRCFSSVHMIHTRFSFGTRQSYSIRAKGEARKHMWARGYNFTTRARDIMTDNVIERHHLY